MTNEDFNEVELMAEHEAAKAEAKKKEDAEQEARWAKQREEDAERRRVRNVENSKHLRAIAQTLPKSRRWAIEEDNFRLYIDGVDTRYIVDLEEVWSRASSWRSKPTGQYSFKVGSIGNGRKTFPQRKDGTFNYKAIGEELAWFADRKNAERKIEKQRARNAVSVVNLAGELFEDVKYQDVITASSDPDKPVYFKFDIRKPMSVDDARKLAVALRDFGLKLHYSDK